MQAVVYFWAHWCHPCKQLDEVFAELAKDSQQAAFIRVSRLRTWFASSYLHLDRTVQLAEEVAASRWRQRKCQTSQIAME